MSTTSASALKHGKGSAPRTDPSVHPLLLGKLNLCTFARFKNGAQQGGEVAPLEFNVPP